MGAFWFNFMVTAIYVTGLAGVFVASWGVAEVIEEGDWRGYALTALGLALGIALVSAGVSGLEWKVAR